MALPAAKNGQLCLGIPKFLLLISLGVLMCYFVLGKRPISTSSESDLGERFITETREASELTDTWEDTTVTTHSDADENFFDQDFSQVINVAVRVISTTQRSL